MSDRFKTADRQRLRQLATDSIHHGLEHGTPQPVALPDWPAALRVPGASFVTLNIDAQLRGCIGSIEARRPLAEDVSANAYAAAFRDPRFPPCQARDIARLQISLSVLGPLKALSCDSQAELLQLLRPHQDGLMLQAHGRRAVFLPQVWEQLPQPRDFVQHLLLKAGLSSDVEPPDLQAWRYEVEHF